MAEKIDTAELDAALEAKGEHQQVRAPGREGPEHLPHPQPPGADDDVKPKPRLKDAKDKAELPEPELTPGNLGPIAEADAAERREAQRERPGFIDELGDDDLMVLRMPRTRPYEDGFEFPEGNLDFGPSSRFSPDHDRVNIKFTADGEGDGYAIVRKDHPLLDDLFRRYPQVKVVESSAKTTAYVCDVCDDEFKTKNGLAQHKRSHK